MNRRTFLTHVVSTAAAGAVILSSKAQAMEAIGQVLCPQDESSWPREELELLGLEKPNDLRQDEHLPSLRLRARAYEAFLDMRADAKRQHVEMYPGSCYRTFGTQRTMWNKRFSVYHQKKFSPQQALDARMGYLAIPGTSRHHWGTDVDITGEIRTPEAHTLRARYFVTGGIFEDVAVWLRYNANTFGFYRVYTEKPGRTGFRSEPWHYSFAESALPSLRRFMEIEVSKYLVCAGVEGSEHLTPEFLDRYKQTFMLGINPKLIPAQN